MQGTKCEIHAMLKQQKHDFVMCKSRAIAISNIRIPLDTSHMQYKDRIIGILYGTILMNELKNDFCNALKKR